jgi:hypothetical protein
VVLLPYIAETMAVAEGCLLMGSLCISCHILAEADDESCGLVGLAFVVKDIDGA